MRRSFAVVLLVLAMSGAGLTVPAEAAAPAWRGVIIFDKNQQNPSNSRVIWRLLQRQGGVWKIVESKRWRAGSGMLGKAGRNSCVNNKGWLPNGNYRVRQHEDYHGNLIKGRAFRLDDKRCSTGNRRFDLFLHTEQGARNSQCPDRPGDQVCRWEFPKVNDYKSAGCIKMSPTDLADLVNHFQKRFRPGVRYAKARVVLRVVS